MSVTVAVTCRWRSIDVQCLLVFAAFFDSIEVAVASLNQRCGARVIDNAGRYIDDGRPIGG